MLSFRHCQSFYELACQSPGPPSNSGNSLWQEKVKGAVVAELPEGPLCPMH